VTWLPGCSASASAASPRSRRRRRRATPAPWVRVSRRAGVRDLRQLLARHFQLARRSAPAEREAHVRRRNASVAVARGIGRARSRCTAWTDWLPRTAAVRSRASPSTGHRVLSFVYVSRSSRPVAAGRPVASARACAADSARPSPDGGLLVERHETQAEYAAPRQHAAGGPAPTITRSYAP
jgi:hypothetical protein